MALPDWEREDLRTELEARIARTKRSKLFEAGARFAFFHGRISFNGGKAPNFASALVFL